MQGVTTALVLFIFASVAFPKMIRNKPQFYIAVALTAAIIVLDAVGFMVRHAGETDRPGALGTFLYVIVALCQFLAFVALILGSGGLSMKELADDMAGAFEAARHGEERTVVVPLSGKKKREAGEEEERVVYTINSPDVGVGTGTRPGANDPIPFDEDEDGPIQAPPPPADVSSPAAPAAPDLAPPPAHDAALPPPRRPDSNLPQ